MGSPHLPPPPLLDAAWYPDPTGRYEARYWDGRKWTSHISHYGATGADPLLRARWDNVWVRGLGRIVMWAAFVGVAYWAFQKYWPEDTRDIAAEQELIESSVMIVSDLPQSARWSPSTATVVSPLKLELDDEGEATLVACKDFADETADAADEPRATSQFADSGGLQTVGNAVAVGGSEGFARGYLDQLADETTGPCLGALWAQVLGGTEVVVASVEAMNPPSFGDESVWWRLSGTDERAAFDLDVLVDLVFVRSGRAVSEYTFSGSLTGIGVDVQRDAIAASVARMGSLLEVYDAEGDDDGDTDGDAPTDGGEGGGGAIDGG